MAKGKPISRKQARQIALDTLEETERRRAQFNEEDAQRWQERERALALLRKCLKHLHDVNGLLLCGNAQTCNDGSVRGQQLCREITELLGDDDGQ